MNKLKCKDFYKVPGIYKITNIINSKFYIGSSVNLYNRNRSHISKLSLREHSNDKLQNSVNKHGIDNFFFEIIISGCNISDLLTLEGYYISELKPEYNIDKVDLNGKRACSESTKILIGKKSKQKFIDNPKLLEQQRLKMKEIGGWCKGLTGIHSKEGLEKLKKAGTKNIKNRAPEIQQKFYDARKLAQEKRKKTIIQFDLNMNILKEWESMSAAAKFYNANNAGNIHTACKKGIKLYNSYWRVKE